MKKVLLFAAILVLAFFLFRGGGKLSGTYTLVPNSSMVGAYENLNFTSGKTVELGTMAGTVPATYKVNGKKLTLAANNGQTLILTIDGHGDIDGGQMIGKFHKQ
jgi:hypothetical protein